MSYKSEIEVYDGFTIIFDADIDRCESWIIKIERVLVGDMEVWGWPEHGFDEWLHQFAANFYEGGLIGDMVDIEREIEAHCDRMADEDHRQWRIDNKLGPYYGRYENNQEWYGQ